MTSSPTTQATAIHLAQLIEGFQHAMNDRSYSLWEPRWQPMASNLEIQYAGGWGVSSLKDHLHYLDQWCTMFPDVTVRYHSMHTELDNEAGRYATTLAEMEIKNMPLNTVRNRIQTFEWKQLAGSWRCTRSIVMEGSGAVGPGD